MAQVFAARHPVLERRVAIKILQAEARSDPAIEARFLDDARAANVLSHPNIVSVVDVDVDAATGVPFIVMERVDGRTLEEMLETQGRLPSAEVVRLGLDVARALDAAHGAGIIHRDVKPSNVLVDRKTGRGYLTDFGAAKRFQAGQPGRTVHGQLIGTPWYMAPEQLEGIDVDARTDLYGLGVTLYQMLTGTKPFDASSREGLYRAILLDQPKPIAETVPDVLPGLEVIVTRLLSKKPADRPASAAEVVEALAHISNSPAPVKADPPVDPTPAPAATAPGPMPPGASPSVPASPATAPSGPGAATRAQDMAPATKGPTMKTKAAIAIAAIALLLIAGLGWLLTGRPGDDMAEAPAVQTPEPPAEPPPAPPTETATAPPAPAPEPAQPQEPAQPPEPASPQELAQPAPQPQPDVEPEPEPEPEPQTQASDTAPEAPMPPAQVEEPATTTATAPTVEPPAETAPPAAEPPAVPAAPIVPPATVAPSEEPATEQAQAPVEEPEPAPDPEALVTAMDEVACANAAADVGGEGRVTLQGTVPDQASVQTLISAVQAVEGVREVQSKLEVRPAPGCLAVAAIAELPAIGGEPPSISLNRPDAVYADQEMLVITASLPSDAGGFLFVDLFGDDGQVLHVLPEKLASANQLPPGGSIQIGVEEQDRKPGVRDLRISAPFVPIHIVATLADKPLYEGLRPLSEPIADYQRVLQDALASAAPGSVRQAVMMIDLIEKRPAGASAAQ